MNLKNEIKDFGVVTLFAIFLTSNALSQTQFWGMTSEGGQYGAGTIFTTDGSGENQIAQRSFYKIPGKQPGNKLTQAPNGMFYGMTSSGGKFGAGVLFQFDAATSAYNVVVHFDALNGGYASGSLMLASDGMLYGLTAGGGSNISGALDGVLFQFNPVTSTYIKKIDFDQNTIGAFPVGSLVEAADGMLYGMTSAGGNFGSGTIFQYDRLTSSITKKIDLESGSRPSATSSFVQATNGMLYAMTPQGGSNNFGTLFQYDPTTNTYNKKIDFSGTANGRTPMGSLVQASDGMLYGMTQLGGVGNFGTLFQYDPTTNNLLKKYDFVPLTDGARPTGSLMQASDGTLYGLARQGGINGRGVIFQFDLMSSSYLKKYDFSIIDGSSPQGNLMQASDGSLYGLTDSGGVGTSGTLFRYDPVGLTFTKLLDFEKPGLDGGVPFGSLLHASDGKLYGMTTKGGLANLGTLFQYDPTTATYTKKFDFDGAANGSNPQGSLMQTPDGMIYGMASEGGLNNKGVLFQYDPTTSTFTKKFDFSTMNGRTPLGRLIVGSDGMLYGTAIADGANGKGVLFQYDPSTSSFTKKYDFDGPNGDYPVDLIEASDGMLYGITAQGGVNSKGVLFQYNPATSNYTKKFDFDGTNTGAIPFGSLTMAQDGMLYGLTNSGGLFNAGTLFQYNPVNSQFTKKHDFNHTNGSQPYNTLLLASNGRLYGTTRDGGGNNQGVLFEYDPTTSVFTKKYDFTDFNGLGENGTRPYLSGLIEVAVTNIVSSPFSPSNICSGNSIDLNFPATGAFNRGNVFMAQLSDATGSFTSPINIGSLNSVKPGVITVTIPQLTPGGSSYRIRVLSTNPAITGVESPMITVNTGPPSPGTITGDMVICPLSTNHTYSIDPVIGALYYTWTLPIGWSGTSTNNSIVVDAGNVGGNISVVAHNSLCASNPQMLAVTINTVPGQPGIITGNQANCSGSLNTYSITSVDGATSYTWTLPSGWTGTSTTTSIDATASATSGDISVTANNTCGSSTAQTLAITVNSIPAQPGTISGNATICSGSLNTYSITSVAGATSYTWTLPSGWTGTSTTNSIDATASATSGDISVTANNECGSSTAQTLAITVNSIPAQPGTISGNVTICSGSLNTYNITSVAGATSYTWTMPGGWTGTSNTNSIDATASATSGDISVTANNSCGSSTTQTLAITANSIPAQQGPITGNVTICSGSLNTYSIASVAGATSYTWTMPGGWTGTSNTNTIDATASATSGDISVTANNSCGSSTAQTLAITANSIPAQQGPITGNATICSGNLNTYSIASVAGATSYTWTMPGGWTGTSNTNTIDATPSAMSGDISVTANNSCGSSTEQTLAITVNSIPAQPGTVGGASTICSGSLNTYSVTPVAGATNYTWTMPGGWTGTSTTNSINATASASSGDISVTANNGCGSSVPGIVAITTITVVKPIISIDNTNPGSPTLTSSSNEGNQWYLNGSLIPGATAKTHTVNSKGSYQVKVTIDNCASELSESKVFVITGDPEEASSSELATLYPNPVENRLVVRLSGFDPDRYVNVNLIDGIGRRVTEVIEMGEKEINIEVGHHASGVYFLQMIQGKEAQLLRFIKK